MQLSENARHADTALLLLHDTEMTAPRLRAGAARVEPRYAIVRPDGDGTVELAATESTPVRPGDTIKVELPLPELRRPAARRRGARSGRPGRPACPRRGRSAAPASARPGALTRRPRRRGAARAGRCIQATRPGDACLHKLCSGFI